MAYATVLVGTDGSEPSLRAVRRAAEITKADGAELVVMCAYTTADGQPARDAQEALGEDAFQVMGANPAELALRAAGESIADLGIGAVHTKAVDGKPVPGLLAEQERVHADLLVVGNRGLNTLAGRMIGSVPSEVARKAVCDVLIVHTTS